MTGTHRLADVARVVRGRAAAHTVPESEGLKLFGIAEITARGHGTPRYLEHGAEVDGPTVAEGDVVVALLGNIGDAALVDASNAGAVLARDCAALRVPVPNTVRPAWLAA